MGKVRATGKINHIKGEFKFKRTYTCHVCQAKEAGSTESVAIDTFTRIDAETTLFNIERSPLEPNYMPVGWASFWSRQGTVFKCPNCKGE